MTKASLEATTALAAIIEGWRKDTIDNTNRTADAMLAELAAGGAAPVVGIRIPTLEQCQDMAKNKNGDNLTERGLEILFRLFDDGAGYNRASKSLNITQTAARNRKGQWVKLGGLNRERMHLPGIDD